MRARELRKYSGYRTCLTSQRTKSTGITTLVERRAQGSVNGTPCTNAHRSYCHVWLFNTGTQTPNSAALVNRHLKISMAGTALLMRAIARATHDKLAKASPRCSSSWTPASPDHCEAGDRARQLTRPPRGRGGAPSPARARLAVHLHSAPKQYCRREALSLGLVQILAAAVHIHRLRHRRNACTAALSAKTGRPRLALMITAIGLHSVHCA